MAQEKWDVALLHYSDFFYFITDKKLIYSVFLENSNHDITMVEYWRAATTYMSIKYVAYVRWD